MDLYLTQIINAFGQGTWIDGLSYTISRIPFFGLMLLLIVLLSYRKGNSQQRLHYLVAVVLGIILFYLINDLTLKHLLTERIGTRQRPYIANPESIHSIGVQLTDSSFPSSHMASSLVILTLWVRRSSKMWIYAVVITLMLGLSRIHNGMHYPTDVLAGILFGIIYGLLAIGASKRIINKRPELK